MRKEEFGIPFLRVLEKKVQQGVEVRVMYDGLCSLTKLPVGYFKKLRRKGIKSKTICSGKTVFYHPAK